MSLGNCIPGLVTEGKLSKKQGETAQAAYDRHLRRLSRELGPVAAAAEASEAALKELGFAARKRKRLALLQEAARREAGAKMATFDGGAGERIDQAAVALLVRDERANYPNVEYRERFHQAEAHAEMVEIVDRFSRNAFGAIRHKADLDNLGRQVFGEETGELSAKEMAAAWQKTAETLRLKRNAAGGETGRLERWGLPQHHDSLAVAQAGFEAWRAVEVPRWDLERMIDEETGLPFDGERLSRFARDLFETISTDGWARREPSAGGQGKMLANRRADHRVIFYKSFDDWKASHEQFGAGGTISDGMMRHIDGMARDVAMMEILGPNPATTVQWLQAAVTKEGALGKDAIGRDRASVGAAQLGRIFGELTGANSRPESRAIALGFSGLRAWQVSTKLGSATISAVSDLANQTTTRLYNGLPVTRMMSGYLKTLKPSLKADRAQAMRFGLTADDAAAALGGTNRFTGAELTGEIARRMAEMTLRLSMLNRVTRVGRWSFGMDAISTLTDESVKGWSALDGRFRGMLRRYGLGEGEWDVIRATPLELEGAAPWINPLSIDRMDLRSRVVEMILSETDMAVPTPGVRIRAAVSGIAPSGNLGGELMRTAFQFKGFGVSMLITNWRRMMATSSLPARVAYGVGLPGLLMTLGVLSIQMRTLRDGKDPRPLEDEALWMQGAFQGGALGIYGDFLTSAQNRMGGGVMDTLAGPSWNTVNQAAKIAVGDPLLAAKGEKTSAGREAVRLVQQETPVIGSNWLTRAAYNRLATDFLQEALDPKYMANRRRLQRRAGEMGTDYFWAPGDTAPGRAPDVANAWQGETPE